MTHDPQVDTVRCDLCGRRRPVYENERGDRYSPVCECVVPVFADLAKLLVGPRKSKRTKRERKQP